MSGTSEGPPVVEGAYEASDAHLKKQISLFGLIALAVSVQVGSGWLLATLAAASIAGPASILTWVLGAVFFGIIGVTWMELGAMLLFVAYIGQFGPMDTQVLAGPIDLIIMIAISIASFLWSVRAGGPTEELGEILAAQEERSRAGAVGS